MRFSLKSDYALRATLDLAARPAGSPAASTAEIARRIGAPPKFLEAVIAQLRRAGLVESVRGARGGHRLARSPLRITAGDVLRAVDGPGALSANPAPRRTPGGGAERAIHQLWERTGAAVADVLDGATLDELARDAEQASGSLDWAI